MIDIHAHYLPAVDDGAKDVRESIRMLTEAFKQGVTVCAGTPHVLVHKEGDVDTFLEKRKASEEELNAFLSGTEGAIPRLIYGAEVFLDNDISKYKDIKKLCISGTDLLLVELSTVKSDSRYSEWLYSLNLIGIVPVIADFERYGV